MENYEPGMSFDEAAAEIYDDEPRGDEEAAVSFLEQIVAGGPALELAIGTGRIALPLRRAASASTASTSLRRWSRSCAPSRW